MRRRPGPRRPPALVAIPAALATLVLILPLIGLLSRVPWSDLAGILASGPVLDALALSLATATTTTVVALCLGLPLAWVLARVDAPGIRVLRAAVTLPMVLPPVVGGAALLFTLGRRGLVGPWLDNTFGLVIPFSTPAVVIAQTFVAMPFLVITAESALRGVDRRREEAAATLGAGPLTVLSRITLPLARPGIIAGAVLCWARALGEFGATITFAGNAAGETRTMPVAVFLALQDDRGAAVALSVILVAVSLVVLVALRGRWLTRP